MLLNDVLSPFFFLLLLLAGFITLPAASMVSAEGECLYTIHVRTGDITDAGTNAVMSLVLSDQPTAGKAVVIPNLEQWGTMGAGHNYFEQGSLDSFSGRATCLSSPPCWMLLAHDNSGSAPGWFADFVLVTMVPDNTPANASCLPTTVPPTAPACLPTSVPPTAPACLPPTVPPTAPACLPPTAPVCQPPIVPPPPPACQPPTPPACQPPTVPPTAPACEPPTVPVCKYCNAHANQYASAPVLYRHVNVPANAAITPHTFQVKQWLAKDGEPFQLATTRNDCGIVSNLTKPTITS